MKTFLVPVDFSDVSYTTAQYAFDLAAYLNAKKIIIYHSYRDTPKSRKEIIEGNDLYHRAATTHIGRMLEKLSIPAAVSSDKIVVLADDKSVKDGIESIVEEYNVSLIIMGIAGLSDIENTLIGRNTIGVAESSPAPLLIVPRHHTFKPVKKVVYATDLREVEATTPVDSIKRLAGQLNAETHIIHVDYAAQHRSPETVLYQKQLLRYLRDLNPTFEVVQQHKDKAYGIFDYVKYHDIDLILMASRNYGFFESIFHNSVSKKLLNIADVPVVLLKKKPMIV